MSDEARRTLMATTPGITQKRFARDPLLTEGEATPGDDDLNPFVDAEAREEVQRVAQKEREQRDGQLFKTVPANLESPTDGDDPYTFDDVGFASIEDSLPGFASVDPFNSDGPEF